MTGLELQISFGGSDRSTDCAKPLSYRVVSKIRFHLLNDEKTFSVTGIRTRADGIRIATEARFILLGSSAAPTQSFFCLTELTGSIILLITLHTWSVRDLC